MIKGMRHPFFLPVWRRAATVALTGAWAILEGAVLGNQLWAFGFAVLSAVCLYEFFVIFDPENYQDPQS